MFQFQSSFRQEIRPADTFSVLHLVKIRLNIHGTDICTGDCLDPDLIIGTVLRSFDYTILHELKHSKKNNDRLDLALLSEKDFPERKAFLFYRVFGGIGSILSV